MSALGNVRAFLEQNRKQLAVAGAVGVGGLALVANRRKAGAGDQAPAGEEAAGIGASKYGMAPLPATGAGGVYDSTASDVYNAIQPQLEDLGRDQAALEKLLEKLLNQKPAPTPVAKPPVTRKPPIKAPPTPAPKPAPPKAGPKAAPKAPPKPGPAPKPQTRTYVVKPGDNLSRIAQRYYGRQTWRKVYDANRGTIGGNPNLIRPGQTLVIPT